MKLTSAQVEQFRRDGYLIVENVIPEADLQVICDALTRWIDARAKKLQAEGKITNLHAEADFARRYARIYRECPNIGGGMDIMHSKIPELFAFLRNPSLMEALSGLLGPEITCNPIQHLRAKPPVDRSKLDEEPSYNGSGNVPWHQDAGVTWEEADDSDIITTWIPLVDATEENGCMLIMPGVHKRGILEHVADGGTQIRPDLIEGCKAVRAECKRGGAILMDRRTPHCSTNNLSDHIRWSLDLRFQPTGVPTGRPFHPDFVTASADPAKILTDYNAWCGMWDRANEKAKGVPWHRTAPRDKREAAMAEYLASV